MKRAKYAVDTKVPVNQTRSEIETILTKFGATSFAFMVNPSAAFSMVTAHESFGAPLTSTRQQPHCPCGAQPFLTEVIRCCSRSTSSSDWSG